MYLIQLYEQSSSSFAGAAMATKDKNLVEDY